jgi:hypothetical protein
MPITRLRGWHFRHTQGASIVVESLVNPGPQFSARSRTEVFTSSLDCLWAGHARLGGSAPRIAGQDEGTGDMTDLIKHVDSDIDETASAGPDGATRGPVPPSPRHLVGALRGRRPLVGLASLVVTAGALGAVVMATTSSNKSNKPVQAHSVVSTVALVSPQYTPHAAVGETDDYHCTLLNPHVTPGSYVISSQFLTGSAEVHHAVLSLVPPSLADTAQHDNAETGGAGWTCFGAPSLPGASFAQFLSTPFLSVWAPGHGADVLPNGTGIGLPAGSMVIMQVHYNLLVGDQLVKNSLVLHTVLVSTPLLPPQSSYRVAPPDTPCPAGVTGPLCNRAASLADQAKRFGADQAETVNLIEQVCGHNPSNPPAGDATSCTWPIGSDGYIVRVQPHMHLLGTAFSMVLNPGTPQAKTILDVPDYNFDYQKARGEGRRQGADQLHPQSEARAAAAHPPQGSTALRDLGGWIIGRDVCRRGVDNVVAAQLLRFALSDIPGDPRGPSPCSTPHPRR